MNPPQPKRARVAIVNTAFVGLLAFTYYQGLGVNRADVSRSSWGELGLQLREVAQEWGVAFTHQRPSVHASLKNIEAQITAVGAAVSVCDADSDGLPDLYVTNSADGSKNALFRNRGEGSFEEVAQVAGIADLNHGLASMGSVWADMDNDGDQDAFIYGWGQCRLMRNEGELRFSDVSQEAANFGHINSNAATWFDYDRDGWLDLYVTGYYAEEHNLQELETTRIMHDSFEFSRNGGRNRLFRNLGNGRFEETTEESGLGATRWTYAAVSADFDRDGWPDLYLANDYGPEELYFNREGRHFELATGIGLEGESKSGMCVALGDAWSEGKLSVFVTNISEHGYLFQGNNLRVNLLGSTGRMLQLAEGPVADCGWAWGAQFADLDDDGFQDLVVANGFVSASQERDYWYQMSKISLATGDVIADAALWPAFEDRSLSGYQRTRVLRNLGTRSGRFMEVGEEVGIEDTYDGRAVSIADLDADGRVDVIIANQRGPLLIYHNESENSGSWVAFDLQGTRSNRDAIGAEIEVVYGKRRSLQVLTSASGFASQNQMQLHFGLGTEPGDVEATIRWPSGMTTQLDNLALNKVHRVVEQDNE